MKLERQIDVTIKPTVDELASCFCDLDADQQAEFFNRIANWVGEWESPLEMQLEYVSQSPVLGDQGRQIMQAIGNYSWHNSGGANGPNSDK